MNELLVNFLQHRLREFFMFWIFSRERIEQRLVFTRCHQPALNTQLVHQSFEAETAHQHTN